MYGVYEIRLGAIYKFASSRRLSKDKTIYLMEMRLGIKPEDALKLAEHWLKTEGFRKNGYRS